MGRAILVADDDADNRTIASDALQAAGFEVLAASDGHEAIELAVSRKPELILLDLSMPKLDGWQAVRRLKTIAETRGIPVIAFTAHAMTGDDRKAREAGCDDYISKPCLPGKIIEKVKEWLPRS